MYLLDTDIISASIGRSPPPALLTNLIGVAEADQFTSTINLGELLVGALKPGVSATILSRVESAVAKLRVLDFDAGAARVYGRIAAYLNSQGTPIGVDTQIAAVALANDLTVVTGNERHFARVPGLRVENWLRAGS